MAVTSINTGLHGTGSRTFDRDRHARPPTGALSSLFDVRSYGAVGDGVIDDTTALQAALNAAGGIGGTVHLPDGYGFAVSATLIIQSRTTVMGGGTIIAKPATFWLAGVFHGFKNLNWSASTITDEDIKFLNIQMDWSAISSGGSAHLFYMRRVRRVVVADCKIDGGASQTAFLGCDDTLVQGNRMLNFLNCGADHWDNPSNGKVIANYINSPDSAQMVNFNPDPTEGTTSPGYVASGFTMTGNTLVSTRTNSIPCQIEPLRAGAYATNISITGNTLNNCTLVLRGDMRAATVAQNAIINTAGAAEPITNYQRFGAQASGLIITGNVILNPATASPNLGVIRAESPTANIVGNVIVGTGYSVSGIYRGNPPVGYATANYEETNPNVGQFQNGGRLDNGGNSVWGWRDASGSPVDMKLQSDNHWLWIGTDSTGASRTIMSMYQRSNTSALNFSVPLVLGGNLTMPTPVQVAAAGTAIGTATALTTMLTEVTSATVGVNDGVRLNGAIGLEQRVVNSTAVTINVYPNNSGSSQIDNGGASVSTNILAGKSKTFCAFSANNIRTVATT